MSDYSYTASEILYNIDYRVYEAEHKAFVDVTKMINE